jgi:hypothetical protein
MTNTNNKIKAIILFIISITIFITTVTMLLVCNTNTHDTYTVHGKVVTTVSNGYCAVVDDDGEEWALYTDNTVECGDRVIIVLDNMGTNTIYDDEVVGIMKE